jgi:hypothetical protein
VSVYPTGVEVRRHARLSPDGVYRYALWREWKQPLTQPTWATFVMLNPSTADHELDDPTIRRCVSFAHRLGATGLVVINLYAFRATAPVDLWLAADPVGPDADTTLREFLALSARHGGPLIAAWGAHARADRVAAVLAMPGAHRFQALGHTKAGAPRHPLYVRGDTIPQPFRPATQEPA